MSQYLNIFVEKDNTFIPIGSYSRSTYMYYLFRAMPYEKIKKVESFNRYIDEIKSEIAYTNNEIKKLNHKIDLLKNMNNVGDIIEAIDHYTEDIAEETEHLNSLQGVKAIVDFLKEIRYEDGVSVYMGIEIGSPTIEDIQD